MEFLYFIIPRCVSHSFVWCANTMLITDVTQRARIGASKLALIGEVSFAFQCLVKASFDAPVTLENRQLSYSCVTSVNQNLNCIKGWSWVTEFFLRCFRGTSLGIVNAIQQLVRIMALCQEEPASHRLGCLNY